MRFFTRFFALHFDRSFSGKSWIQVAWLCGVITIIFLVVYVACRLLLGTASSPVEHFSQLISLFIDPGSVNDAVGMPRWLAVSVAIIGLILFCGMLISVISNMLERRVERFREGDIVYPMHGHVVIIGFDDMVPMLIQQLCGDPRYDGCYILVQSSLPAPEVRGKIHTELAARDEKRVVILHARRDSVEDLVNLYTTKAREVFLIGEREEHDHDSLNIECLKKIVDIHKRQPDCPLIPFTVLFENQTTHAAFQVTDLSSEWRQYIEFRPFNFYEEWAKKLLVNCCYGKGEEHIVYPPLDREPLTYDSPKHVRFVIIGMSRMGVALGVEAAHLLHFPNFCRDAGCKSIITFIDETADREMDFFRGRYRHFFEIASCTYRDMGGGDGETRIIPPTRFRGGDSDFLDVEFEFIKGRAESPLIQQWLSDRAEAEDEVLSIAICLNYPPQSMAMGLYLPDNIYYGRIPVFIRLETSGTLLMMLNSKKAEDEAHKYSCVYPFGMLDNCYDLDKRNIRTAQLVNYVYDYYNRNQTLPQTLPGDEELSRLWNELPVAHQWSNLYNAYSIGLKLRSLGMAQTGGVQLDAARTELLAQVEHNRWNVEKLLLGFRKPSLEEQALFAADPKKKKEYKNRRLVHADICPYHELGEDSKNYDKCITGGIPWVVENSCD